MTHDEPIRREELIREIDVRIPSAINQALVPYRIVVDEMARDVGQLKTVVFGSPALGIIGMVERMKALEGKIDILLDGQTQREKDWAAMRLFLRQDEERAAVQQVIKRGIGRFQVLVALVGGAMVIINLLQLFHIISL